MSLTPKKSTKKIIAGFKENVSFPDWGISHVLAKLDSGAKSSALDVKNIQKISDSHVQFKLVYERKHKIRSTTLSAPIFRTKRVKSSNGISQERFSIIGKIKIGSHLYTVEFSLHCRKTMRCRVLLGRDALLPFLINPSLSFLLAPKKKPKKHSLPPHLPL